MPLGDEVKRRAPLFFFSYAHSSTRQRNRIVRFFNDLSDDVAELVSRPVGSDPGFLDRSMGGDNHWTSELLEAVGTCQVFVALLSAPFFESKWCGMEWYAFAQRTVVPRPGSGREHHTAILPVVWAAPLQSSRIPAVVGNVQRFEPGDLPAIDLGWQYQQKGVVGLLQTQPDLYQAVVWVLAQRIAEIHNDCQVEHKVLQREELHNAFESDQSD